MSDLVSKGRSAAMQLIDAAQTLDLIILNDETKHLQLHLMDRCLVNSAYYRYGKRAMYDQY